MANRRYQYFFNILYFRSMQCDCKHVCLICGKPPSTQACATLK